MWERFSLKHLINKREVFLSVGAILVVTKDKEILSKARFRFDTKEYLTDHPILKVDVITGMVYTYPSFTYPSLFHTRHTKKWQYAAVYTFH